MLLRLPPDDERLDPDGEVRRSSVTALTEAERSQRKLFKPVGRVVAPAAQQASPAVEKRPSASLPSFVAQRTTRYASLLRTSRALHLVLFEQPGKERERSKSVFSQDGSSPSSFCGRPCKRFLTRFGFFFTPRAECRKKLENDCTRNPAARCGASEHNDRQIPSLSF